MKGCCRIWRYCRGKKWTIFIISYGRRREKCESERSDLEEWNSRSRDLEATVDVRAASTDCALAVYTHTGGSYPFGQDNYPKK